MNRITLDSALRVDGGPGRIEIPAARMDGFRVRPQLVQVVNALGFREDSGEAAVLQRGLDYVAARATEVMYPELRAARFFPTIAEVPIGARTFTFAVMDRQGVARRVTGNGDDLPNAGVTLSEVTSGIGSYGAQYGWTTEELRAFDYANANGRGPALALDTARGDQAQLMIARKIDSVCAFGDPEDSRIKGVLNNSNVTVSTAAINWNSATYAELLSELLALANEPVTVSKEIFRPDSILLPTAYLQLVQSVMNAQGTKSVLEAFNDAMKAADRRVSVESWPLLATADSAGTGPRAVSYVRDVEMAGLIIPAIFLPQPPQAKGLRWQIPCEGLCGGAAVRAPLSMYYRDGLNG